MGDTEPVATLSQGITLHQEEGAGMGGMAWDGHCGAGGDPLSSPGLMEELGTGTPPAAGPAAEPRTGSGLFCSSSSWVFFWMYIKVFVWSPPGVLDWVSHWHWPARRWKSVPGSASLRGAGQGGGTRGLAARPLPGTEAFAATSRGKDHPPPAVPSTWTMRDLEVPKFDLSPLPWGPPPDAAAPTCYGAPRGCPKDAAASAAPRSGTACDPALTQPWWWLCHARADALLPGWCWWMSGALCGEG